MDRNISSMMNFNEEKEDQMPLDSDNTKNQLKITLIKNGLNSEEAGF